MPSTLTHYVIVVAVQVSGRHMKIIVTDDQHVQIQDMSTHGTFVNGEKLGGAKSEPQTLHPNDEIILFAPNLEEAKRIDKKKRKAKDAKGKKKKKKKKNTEVCPLSQSSHRTVS